jgi:hypothetical protein
MEAATIFIDTNRTAARRIVSTDFFMYSLDGESYRGIMLHVSARGRHDERVALWRLPEETGCGTAAGQARSQRKAGQGQQ